jgi:hypothetical protein
MNEKYIQALILGSLIGGAILFDDFVKPIKEKSMNKHMIIKSDFKEEDLPDIEDIQIIDVLQNMDISKGLDLEKIKNLEDVNVQIKVEIKKEDKEED